MTANGGATRLYSAPVEYNSLIGLDAERSPSKPRYCTQSLVTLVCFYMTQVQDRMIGTVGTLSCRVPLIKLTAGSHVAAHNY